jgi:glycosyltransferase involved in cell wall biosynthesis
MASGLAVLSFAHAAAKELILHGQNGLLVTTTDELDFVNAAVCAATDRHTLDRVRVAAAPSVAHLAWDAVFDGFVETLSGVLERHGRQFTAQASGLRPNPLNPSSA